MAEEVGAASASSSTPVVKTVDKTFAKLPVCMIVLGMAGSGKTTFVHQLAKQSFERYKPYVINIDPACQELPFNPNIDIRDTIKYKEVMKQYKLGPNGAIVTSLNLFSTKFEKVVELIKRAGENQHKYCIIDTPGQIEVFTWSASGNIITESLAATFPTIVVYVMDVVRSTSPTTFMSNMLYACSIMFKARLPFIVILNKIDLQDHDYAMEWMTDFTAFQDALQNEKDYVSNLTSSLSLTLDEFYSDLKTCGVSSKTGAGFNNFFELIEKSVVEYEETYRQEYLQKCEANLKAQAEAEKRKLEEMTKRCTLGAEVKLTGDFVETVPAGRDYADICLRQADDESSEDDEGEEETPAYNEHVDETNFQAFIQGHKAHMAKKESKQMDVQE